MTDKKAQGKKTAIEIIEGIMGAFDITPEELGIKWNE